MSMRETVLSRIKKGSIPRGEEPTKTSKTISVVFEGSASLISEPKNEGPEIPPEPKRVRSIRNWPELAAFDDREVWTWEKDPPHIRLYAWALLNVPLGTSGQIDVSKAARDCRLSQEEVHEALQRLVREGDLLLHREWVRSRARDSYQLKIRYFSKEGDG